VIDRKEESADSARLHHLDVEALRQHCDRSAANELFVSGLGQHRLADREQDDHHRDPNAVTKEQQHRAPRPIRDVSKRELRDHAPTILPSRM
jgi:hypothetical protein